MADEPMDGEEGGAPEGPMFEVWNHLHAGLDLARMDMTDRLPPQTVHFLQHLAGALVEANCNLLLVEDDPSAFQRLAMVLPERKPGDAPGLLHGLYKWYVDGKDPWFRHAVELEVARHGIARAIQAIDRFGELAPQFAQRPVPDRAQQYLREVVNTFLFGFDAACIALCRSVFEQVAKAHLLERGLYTEPQLKREKPTAGKLLEVLKQSRELLGSGYSAAKRLVDRGSTVAHSHIYDPKILRSQAQASIQELLQVLSAMLNH